MALRLEYQDKYRLWSDLVRARTDRVFIASEDVPQLGSTIRVELALPELSVPIIMKGTVIGRRGDSPRFERGIYVRFADSEIEKCRRFLGIEHTVKRYEHARRTRRVHHELPLRFDRPKLDTPCTTRNISEAGLFVTCPDPLEIGQQVALTLTLDDSTHLALDAEVSWVDHDQNAAGLRFLQLDAERLERLGKAITRLLEAQAREQTQEHVPVVVADDEPAILRFLSSALTKFGFEVFQVANGELALGLIRDLQPKLVLLDILMPGIDGVDVCKMMRADAYMVDIPVIFISALEAKRLHAVADEAGATDYLSKPVDMADLFNLVGRYLRR
jgi:CheY-like chemotaxis protein/Tfp pilus assembly protein PilZ